MCKNYIHNIMRFYKKILSKIFCFNSVLAYSSAELGVEIGSAAGFTLYIFYTLSSLCLANPILHFASSKTGLLIGMVGLLVYVSSFFVALLLGSSSNFIFITGAAIGGIGAGILWPSQGSYYSANAAAHSAVSGNSDNKSDVVVTLNNFAAIFSVFYLSFETGFKLLATFLFLISTSSQFSWRPVVFGLYSVAAFIAVISFYIFGDTLDSPGSVSNDTLFDADDDDFNKINTTNNSYVVLESNSRHMEDNSEHNISSRGTNNNKNNNKNNNLTTSTSSPLLRRNSRCQQLLFSCSKGDDRHIFLQQSLAVSRGLYSSRMMRLLVPYQLCFGFSSGLVSTYINGVIVNTYIGDGYIGLLSSLITIAAVISAGPFAYICNRYRTRGKWVMHYFIQLLLVHDVCMV